jgi:glyoxylase-like metal-dependent hydrolase (beta-lactamase superfamily II)
VWHWETPHPEWQPGERWGPSVSSYAIDEGDGLVLFDPLALPGEIEALAADRETAIVLTCPWHRRDAIGLGERFAAEPPEQVDQILESLRPLLELPVELLLPTHGAPTDRAALERALA